jgi:predicted phage terminase large subunit-like protein
VGAPGSIESLITAEKFRALPKAQKQAIFEKLSDDDCIDLYYNYEFWAREKQLFPPGDWFLWLLLAGRGFGKTWVAANWVVAKAKAAVGPVIAVMAPTAADIRDIMIEGPSGILSRCPPYFKPKYSKSIGQLVFPNGVKVLTFSADDPEQIRGTNSSAMVLDEFAVYRYPRETFDLAVMANRIGHNPQFLISTTPKPIKILREFVQKSELEPDRYVITSGSTYENKDNLSKSFIEQIAVYEGTEIGRQELHAEILNPEETAILKRSWFKLYPANEKLPFFEFIIQSYDTAFTEKTTNDKTAATTWGVFREKRTNRYAVLLLDSWHDWLKYPALRTRAADEFYVVYGDSVQRHIDAVVIEAKGSGISLFQDLRLLDIPAFSYNPGKEDKVMRVHSVSHFCKEGLVYVLESEKRPGEPKTWCKPFLDEVCTFIEPGKEVDDDYVDSLTQALRYLRDIGYLSIENLNPDEEEKVYEKKVNPYAQ